MRTVASRIRRTAVMAAALPFMFVAAVAWLPVASATVMGFTAYTVSPAIGVVQDLYEPTITISSTGTMYVAGHVIGADSTGTPGYYSNNGGVSWTKLPIAASLAAPVVSGSALPGGDEGVIVADGSHAWMVDTEASGNIAVHGYCSNGATACFDQPDAMDNAQTLVCGGPNLASASTDRPWAAEAKVGSSNMLFMVNNGVGTSGNVPQIGLLDVTPGLPAGAVPGTWNACASGPYADGYIPGPPALSTGGRFVVPQIQSLSIAPNLAVVTGTVAGGVGTTTTTAIPSFSVANSLLACSSNYGFAALSNSGTFYVTAASDSTHFKVSATTTGTTFKTTSFATTNPIAFLWITGSQSGEGALVSWAEDKSSGACTNVDFHAAHIRLDASGNPQMSDPSTVATGKKPCGDLMGSSVDSTGNAAVVIFSHANQCTDSPLALPLQVYVQSSGTKL